jgi:hypothetical protein
MEGVDGRSRASVCGCSREKLGFATTSRQDEPRSSDGDALAVEIAKAASANTVELPSGRSWRPGAAPWRRTLSRSRSREKVALLIRRAGCRPCPA